MAKSKYQNKAEKLEIDNKVLEQQVMLLDEALNDARDNLNRVNDNADQWKIALKGANQELDKCADLIDDLEAEKKKVQNLNDAVDGYCDKIEHYRNSFSERSNTVARLAEQGLIEAQAFGDESDGDSDECINGHRLIGRLEGHLRSIINATGCEYRVKCDEPTGPDYERKARPKYSPSHGSVIYKDGYRNNDIENVLLKY